MQEGMQDTLKTIAWKGENWDKKQIEKYQLFLHNLNTQANVWLFFYEKEVDANTTWQHDLFG